MYGFIGQGPLMSSTRGWNDDDCGTVRQIRALSLDKVFKHTKTHIQASPAV